MAVQVEDIDQQVEEARAEEWQLASAAFADGAGWEDIKLTKVHRVQGMKHMLVWDNALRGIGVASGFKLFVADRELAQRAIPDLPLSSSPTDRPASIVFALDQGPQSFPTVFYMAYDMKIHTFWHYDGSHRLWNDVKDAMADTGNWGFVCISTIIMNLDYGPWDGSEFYHRAKEAMCHFVTNSSVEHPLFMRFASAIAQDDGLDTGGGVFSAAQLRDIFDSLSDHKACLALATTMKIRLNLETLATRLAEGEHTTNQIGQQAGGKRRHWVLSRASLCPFFWRRVARVGFQCSRKPRTLADTHFCVGRRRIWPIGSGLPPPPPPHGSFIGLAEPKS